MAHSGESLEDSGTSQVELRWMEVANESLQITKLLVDYIKGAHLINALSEIQQGDVRGISERQQGAVRGLSDKESDVLGLVSLGFSNKEIAQRLFVEEQTVKFHLSNIYRELEVKNRTEASSIAIHTGLLREIAQEDRDAWGGGKFMEGTRKALAELITSAQA